MTPFVRNLLLAFIWYIPVSHEIVAQNLVPNPSLEIFTTCPFGFGTGGPLQATPWQSGTQGSVDYFNACGNPSPVGVPQNFFGYQAGHTGVAYVGGYFRLSAFEYREYPQVQLISPLVGGTSYDISFWISLANNGCGTSHVGVYFSVNAPPNGTIGVLNVTPQFEANLGYISDTTNWVLVEGCYLAQGGEEFITIGNFYNDANTTVDPTCPNPGVFTSYYYIDDVSISVGNAPENIDFELGGPVEACYEYTIEPDITGVNYTWEDGSHDPTLTVTQSGIYSLTVSMGCDYGVDSIEVTILGVDPVEIGPAEALICDGDEINISLDPDVGDYEWQDGSTNPEYSITTPGLYSVTLDDGCEESTDMINVILVDPPAPFTLGDDTYICPGDEISYDFDPGLGDFLWNDGSTSSSFSIDEGGTYSLTISNMCGEEADEIEIETILPPTVDIGPEDVLMCEGNVIVVELDPDQGEYVWQDGSMETFYEISEPGAYHVSVMNECGTDEDDMLVSFIPDPVFDLGPDITVCPLQLPVLLDVSESGGTDYLWSTGSTQGFIEVTESGLYEVEVSNECVALNDQISIVVEDDIPAVILPEDLVLCPGETTLLFNTGTAGDYLWQDLSENDTYLVTSPGTYSLTVTNACGVGQDTVVVDYIAPIAVPDLGPDFTLCPGEQAVLSVNASGVNYTWQDLSTADTFLVTTSGTYSVQIQNQCSVASDTIEVTFNANPPDIDLPQQLSLCQGNTLTLDAGITGVTYSWNDGTQLSTLDVSSPGSYSLTVTNACGADIDTVVVLDGGPAPFVSLGNDVQFCAGDTIDLNPANTDVTSWLWSDNTTLSTFEINSPGMVSVQVSNACGIANDTLNATLLPATPPLDLGNDTSLCPGETFVLTISIPSVNILWSDGSQNNQLLIQGAGQFYATISNTCGANADTVVVTDLPAAPSVDLGADQSLCPGELLTIDPGIPNVNYLWQDGSTGISFTTMLPGTIILTLSNVCGSDTDSLEIIESTDGPQIDLGPDVEACVGETVTIHAGISGVNYLWQDGSSLSSYTTPVSDTLILQVSNNCGSDLDTVLIDISGIAPVSDLGPDSTLCTGESLLLNVNPPSGSTIQWQDGSAGSSFPVTSAGIYSVRLSNNCGNDTDSVEVEFLDPPALFYLGPDTILCPGESIVLKAPATTDALLWQDGSSASTLVADQEQTYSLSISNKCGTRTDDLALSYDSDQPVVDLDSALIWCPGDVIDLDVSQPFPAVYNWNTGSASPSIAITTPGIFEVTVSTLCFNDQDVIVIATSDICFPQVEFFVPNIFSPNNDFINDIFRVEWSDNAEVTGLHGSIFDRWGDLVFDSQAIPFEWNGRFNEDWLNPAVYVYRIRIEYNVNGEPRSTVLTGDITLVR